jgi:hypothetical protein
VPIGVTLSTNPTVVAAFSVRVALAAWLCSVGSVNPTVGIHPFLAITEQSPKRKVVIARERMWELFEEFQRVRNGRELGRTWRKPSVETNLG